LPFYYRKFRPSEFNVLRHVVLPVLGMIAMAVPVYYLAKPGQSAPYDWFPYAALAIAVVSVVYGYFLNRVTRRSVTESAPSSPTNEGLMTDTAVRALTARRQCQQAVRSTRLSALGTGVELGRMLRSGALQPLTPSAGAGHCRL